MNESLTPIYSDFIDAVGDAVPAAHRDELCGPFLIEPTPQFIASSPRIMVFGQETYGWDTVQTVLGSGAETSLNTYREFDYGEAYRRSPFWAFVREVAEGLGLDRRALLWNNLVKFDYHGSGTACRSVLWTDLKDACLRAQAGVIAREVEALNVDFCLFLTGPYYDNAIRSAFPDTTFESFADGFTERQVATVRLGSSCAGAIRTYHPAYLRRSGLWTPVREAVLSRLKQAC